MNKLSQMMIPIVLKSKIPVDRRLVLQRSLYFNVSTIFSTCLILVHFIPFQLWMFLRVLIITDYHSTICCEIALWYKIRVPQCKYFALLFFFNVVKAIATRKGISTDRKFRVEAKYWIYSQHDGNHQGHVSPSSQ